MNQVTAVATLIVTVAMVAVIVQSRFTAGVIGAIGDAFSESISAAMGASGRR